MNFSSLSDKTSNQTLQSLNHDELCEKFTALKSQYDNLSKQYEITRQELYDTKKNAQFAQELKDHLESEIDTCQKNELKLKRDFNKKVQSHNEEIESLRQENWNECEVFKNTIETLQNKLKFLEDANNINDNKNACHVDYTKFIEDAKCAENEIRGLESDIVEYKTELAKNSKTMENLNDQLKAYEDYIKSLKCNYENKNEELLSVREIMLSMQEDLCEANAELQRYKNKDGTHAVKGNSLFAEVDDKRQEMLKTLSHMKEKVHQLNRELLCKQAEVDSLLCEKKTLWEEYTGQAEHNEAVMNCAYERRITDLEKQCNQLHREISRWYEKNLNHNEADIARWVSGVLEYYRQDNSRLTKEFSMSSVDNLVKEKNLRDSKRQVVIWRTKANEAFATISQLETKLSLAEKSASVNNVPSAASVAVSDENHVSPDIQTETKVESHTEIDGEKENMTSEDTPAENDKLKDIINKPGILVTGGVKNKVVKKATFQ